MPTALRSLRAAALTPSGIGRGLQPRKREQSDGEQHRLPLNGRRGLRPEISALSEQPGPVGRCRRSAAPPTSSNVRSTLIRVMTSAARSQPAPHRLHDCAQSGRTLGRDAMRAPDVCVFDGRKRGAARRLGRAALARIRPRRPSCLASSLGTVRCATARTGWDPRHLTLWRGTKLIAAAPGYARDDSDGDFSRDWDLAASLSRGRSGTTRSSRSPCRSPLHR